jgi:nitrate reductase gamma subunit
MNGLLDFSQHRLQELALAFMALVYLVRIAWLLRFKPGGERQGQTGPPSTTPTRGILYSWAIIAMPWAMESTRKKFPLYLQFVIFHLGVAAAIALSFIIPYGPALLEHGLVVLALQAIMAAACAVGVIRMARRIGSQYMRAISSPDDYFSLGLLTCWLFSAVLAAPNDTAHAAPLLLAFFLLTAFFLVYVPFSKISHYLYYPFTRYYFGKSMGYRGVYPVRRGPTAG